ncbi:MAG: methyltransferase domain-containing protein [Nitrospinota bacterium]
MLLKPWLRSEAAELLDEKELPREHLEGNLRDIARINRLTGGTSTLVRSLAALVQADFPNRPSSFSVLDVGTGAGDIPRAVADWAEAEGRTARIWAIDINPDIVRFAVGAGPGLEGLGFAVSDAGQLPIRPRGVDYVVASLFLHHFDRKSAVGLLRGFSDCARRAVIINDLRRARLPYAAIFLLTRLATRNLMTRHDAPLSVLRAFLPDELEAIAREAGFESGRITRVFPYRLNWVGRAENGP